MWKNSGPRTSTILSLESSSTCSFPFWLYMIYGKRKRPKGTSGPINPGRCLLKNYGEKQYFGLKNKPEMAQIGLKTINIYKNSDFQNFWYSKGERVIKISVKNNIISVPKNCRGTLWCFWNFWLQNSPKVFGNIAYFVQKRRSIWRKFR